MPVVAHLVGAVSDPVPSFAPIAHLGELLRLRDYVLTAIARSTGCSPSASLATALAVPERHVDDRAGA